VRLDGTGGGRGGGLAGVKGRRGKGEGAGLRAALVTCSGTTGNGLAGFSQT